MGLRGEGGSGLAEVLTGPSCPADSLPDAVGIEGDDSHLVVGQWPEALQSHAVLISWDAHLPESEVTSPCPAKSFNICCRAGLASSPPVARLAEAVPALSEVCTGPYSQSQGHWLPSTGLAGTGYQAQTAAGLGGQRSSHRLGKEGSRWWWGNTESEVKDQEDTGCMARARAGVEAGIGVLGVRHTSRDTHGAG